jgi:hypothetical protein
MRINRRFPSSIALLGALWLAAVFPAMAAPSLDTLYTFKESSTGGHALGTLTRDGDNMARYSR